MPSLALAGSEEIWEGSLATYQAQREAEVDFAVLVQRQNVSANVQFCCAHTVSARRILPDQT